MVIPQVNTPVQALTPARSASPAQSSTAATSQTTATSLSEESEPLQAPADPFPWRMVKKRKGRKAAPNQIPPPPPLAVTRKQLKKATAAQKPVPPSTATSAPAQQHFVPARAGPARVFQDSYPALSPQQRPADVPVQPQASTPPSSAAKCSTA
jgi:hypothetical protein